MDISNINVLLSTAIVNYNLFRPTRVGMSARGFVGDITHMQQGQDFFIS